MSNEVAQFQLWNEEQDKKNEVLPQANNTPTKEVLSFSNNDLGNVRVVMIDDEPHFCLSDLAKVLNIQNGRDLKNAIDTEFDKGGSFNLHPLKTNGGTQKFTFLNESELYFVLMRSNSVKAKPFRQWVTKEVLPSIRKTGSYSTQQKIPQTYAEALLEAGRLALELEKTQTQLAQAKPKIEFADSIMKNSQAISVGDFAKLLSKNGFEIGQKRLFEWLRQKEYINERNIPYQQYIKQGLFSLIEESYSVSVYSRIYLKTLITGKGQIYFCEKIRKEFAKI